MMKNIIVRMMKNIIARKVNKAILISMIIIIRYHKYTDKSKNNDWRKRKSKSEKIERIVER